MRDYQKILVAIDFSASSKNVVQKAINLKSANSQLHLIHVVDFYPPMVGFDPGTMLYEIPFDDEELVKNSKKQLNKISAEFEGRLDKVETLRGSAKDEVVHYADENNIDLIVMGSHGQSGIALLLGSTTDYVMHHASCDVLAVRVTEE